MRRPRPSPRRSTASPRRSGGSSTPSSSPPSSAAAACRCGSPASGAAWRVEPADFEGWGVFRPASHALARLVRPGLHGRAAAIPRPVPGRRRCWCLGPAPDGARRGWPCRHGVGRPVPHRRPGAGATGRRAGPVRHRPRAVRRVAVLVRGVRRPGRPRRGRVPAAGVGRDDRPGRARPPGPDGRAAAGVRGRVRHSAGRRKKTAGGARSTASGGGWSGTNAAGTERRGAGPRRPWPTPGPGCSTWPSAATSTASRTRSTAGGTRASSARPT